MIRNPCTLNTNGLYFILRSRMDVYVWYLHRDITNQRFDGNTITVWCISCISRTRNNDRRRPLRSVEFLRYTSGAFFFPRVFILFIPRRNLRPGPRDVTVLTTITINSPTGSLWHNYCIAFSSRVVYSLFFFFFILFFNSFFFSVLLFLLTISVRAHRLCAITARVNRTRCAV